MDTGRLLARVRSRTFLLRLAAAAVVLALVATLAGQGPPAPSGPTFSVPPAAVATPGASTGATPTAAATEGPWAKLTLLPSAAIADIEATRVIGNSVATQTAFTVKRLGAIAAADLAARVTAQPPIAFELDAGATADSATLVPTHALSPGTRYRLSLVAPDGSLAGSWTFRTASPLHVVGRIPDDRTSDVPLTTGIEVTFDQDTPVGVPAHFRISPDVAGRFEQRGRTTVFVPQRPLQPGTVYSVTVTHGVQLLGSDEILETDVRWQFSTVQKATDTGSGTLEFPRPVLEVRPGDPLALLVQAGTDDKGQLARTSASYSLYRLTLEQATRFSTTLLSVPDWARWADIVNVIPTSGLPKAASGTAPMSTAFEADSGLAVLRIPVQLDPGWYLAVLASGSRPAQVVLQVTDLAAYVMTTSTRTMAWVNDLATQAPIRDASVAIAGGAVIGRTDASGLMTSSTPSALIDPWTGWDDPRTWPPHVLIVAAPDGRQLIAPLGMTGYGYPADADGRLNTADAAPSYWLLLTTDRGQYRQRDTIHAWGVVRARDGGAVPSGLTLRLSIAGERSISIASVAVDASATGLFAGDLPINDLPTGTYDVSLYAGSRFIQSTWIEVSVIRKPAYRVNVSTDQLVYVDGETIATNGDLAFYDGSSVPGMALDAVLDDGGWAGPAASITSGADGRYSATIRAAWNPDNLRSGYSSSRVIVRPTSAEEGAISGWRNILVFPAAVWLDGSATIANGRLTLAGRVSRLDRAAAATAMAAGDYIEDAGGAGLAGQSVTVRVIHYVPVKTQVGTTYDFITKQVTPLYKYSSRAETLLSKTVVAGTDGAINLSLAVAAPLDQYEVRLGTTDAQGRATSFTVWPDRPGLSGTADSGPYLVDRYGCGAPASVYAAVGSMSDLTVREGDGSVAKDGHYLFLVGRRGLTDVVAQTSSTLRRELTASDLPSYTVSAVRLTTRGYENAGAAMVRVDPATKALRVTVTPVASRYTPGDTASLAIRTIGPDGQPVAADVVVRAVDEKLFTIGAADDIDAAAELLQPQDSGFLQSYTAHPVPYWNPGGCGATGGDGRSDFQDAATFQRTRTGADGRATVSFHLPDDLTSWHVTATAISADLDVGSGSGLVPVGLPFFVDAIIAPEYLAGDAPALTVRAYGTAVSLGSPVRFTVSAPELGASPVSIDGRVGSVVRIPIPALSAGDHRIRIEAVAGALSDTLTRTVHVVPTRLRALRITQQTLAAGAAPGGGSGLTTYVVTDAGRGALLPILRAILDGDGARFDQAAGADLARKLLVGEFDVPDSSLPASTYDPTRYVREGISLLPYSSPDLPLTALAAIAAPDAIDREAARQALASWLAAGETRERTITALAGQAGLGDDVLDQLASYGTDLTLREQIWLGLAYLASGDENSARTIERQVLEAKGQQLDTWVRVDAGPDLESRLEATALQSVLSAGVGDPLAAGMVRYVLSQPSKEHVFSLELLAYVHSGLDRLPRTAASFAWTLDGVRRVQTLAPGDSFGLAVTGPQRAGLTFERIGGDATLTATWIGDAAEATLPSTTGITISRSVSPVGQAPADKVVRVTLTVTFSPTVPQDCYVVTDLLPSGLAPLVNVPGWDDRQGESVGIRPYAADGQRVSWCIDRDTTGPVSPTRTVELAYSARVVTPGTYRWEPAVIQSAAAPSLGAATPATTYVIR
ncbi:MAG TPA: Ig-like domain-containing protein [Candidatus Limnocylindrales bacterium]